MYECMAYMYVRINEYCIVSMYPCRLCGADGPSIKYTSRSRIEGVRGATVCDRGRVGVQERVAYKFFYHTYENWIFNLCLILRCNRCILTKGGTDKNHPGQNLLDKRPPDKPPNKTPENN